MGGRAPVETGGRQSGPHCIKRTRRSNPSATKGQASVPRSLVASACRRLCPERVGQPPRRGTIRIKGPFSSARAPRRADRIAVFHLTRRVQIEGIDAMKLDITKLTQAADRLLPTLSDRRHIAMISNYRRHALLDVSGRYEEILTPQMTVEEPEYWSHTVGGSTNFKGMKAIHSLYKFLVDEDICVQMLENERLMVNDWGFSSFSTFQTF